MILLVRHPCSRNTPPRSLSISSSDIPSQCHSFIWRAAAKTVGSTIPSKACSVRIHALGSLRVYFPFSFLETRLKTLVPAYFSLVRMLRIEVLLQGR